MPDVYYDSSLTGHELDEALRNIPANVKRSEDAAKTAESWAQGGTDTRPGEDEDNAEYWAKQAKADAGTASAGAQVVTDNQEALQAVLDNLDAVKNAAKNAELADASAESAATDAERAEAAAKNAQSIAQGQKGYYETASDLQREQPNGEAGDWALVGETDTVWVWDTDTEAWLNSGNNIDLSHYYTKDETDQQIDELQAALTPHIWTVAVPVTAWVSATDTWAGIAAKYKAQITCEGMTADTQLAPPQYAGGDLASAQTFAWADSSDGAVVLWSETKPGAEFTLTLTEVK